jgi:hypothetical protein
MNRDSILGKDKSFSLLHSIQTDPGGHPASYPMSTRADLEVKRPGLEADRVHFSNAEIKGP